MYIAIAGNIGAGKTTLTKMLAKYYGWEPRFESVSFNPYLEDYYGDINRWAFCLETYFLKERFKDMLAVQKSMHTIVQDRSIFEGVYVFVRNNYERGDLSPRDYEQTMQIDYLKDLNDKYEDFIFHKYEGRVLVIESDGMDFENNPEDFRTVINKVDAELFGLFSETNWSK